MTERDKVFHALGIIQSFIENNSQNYVFYETINNAFLAVKSEIEKNYNETITSY